MSIADELRKLQELRDDGTLSEVEFVQAKAQILNPTAPRTSFEASYLPDQLGEAANTWVKFEMGMKIAGLIFAVIIFFTVFLPVFSRMGNDQPGPTFHMNSPGSP